MQTTNLGNETIGAIWGELVSNQLTSKYMLEEARARYSNSSHKDATLHIIVADIRNLFQSSITHVPKSKFITANRGCVEVATCYSYSAQIRKLLFNTKTRKFEHWINNSRYSHTTGRHQSACDMGTYGMNSSPDVDTFDFTWADDIHALPIGPFYYGRADIADTMLDAIRKKASSLHAFVNTPRRQSKTIARYCSEFLQWLDTVEHCTLGEDESFTAQLEYIDQYRTAARGCVDFDGDKHTFNAVMALID